MQNQEIRAYFITYSVILLICSVTYLSQEHGEAVLWLNANRNQVADFIMKYLTHLGDGIFFGIVVLGILIWKWRVGLVYLTGALVTLAMSSFLKRVVFPGTPRPKKYFEGIQALNFIEGVEVHGKFSFPSGHTMSVFAMVTLFALTFSGKKWIAVILAISAWMVGFTRIYLLQHFLRDVIAGSLVGVLIAILVYHIFKKWLERNTIIN